MHEKHHVNWKLGFFIIYLFYIFNTFTFLVKELHLLRFIIIVFEPMHADIYKNSPQ